MHPALRGPLLGALLGLPILGGGGRLAMHAIALTPGAQRSATVQGTITVLLAGLAAGVAGNAIYTLLTLRGLHPVQPLTLALFLPIVLVFGWLLERSWHARSRFTRVIHTAS